MVLLEERGKFDALECLAFAGLSLGDMHHDNLDGGMWHVELVMSLPPPLYLRLTKDHETRDFNSPIAQIERDVSYAIGESGVDARYKDGEPASSVRRFDFSHSSESTQRRGKPKRSSA